MNIKQLEERIYIIDNRIDKLMQQWKNTTGESYFDINFATREDISERSKIIGAELVKMHAYKDMFEARIMTLEDKRACFIGYMRTLCDEWQDEFYKAKANFNADDSPDNLDRLDDAYHDYKFIQELISALDNE